MGLVKTGDNNELPFQCLQAFVKWHLSMDDSSPDPTEALFAINKPVYEGGKFMHLPYKLWLNCKEDEFVDAIEKVKATWNGNPPEALLRSIGSLYMPDSLKQQLIGPSLPDADLPPLDFNPPVVEVKLYSLEDIMQSAAERRREQGEQGEEGGDEGEEVSEDESEKEASEEEPKEVEEPKEAEPENEESEEELADNHDEGEGEEREDKEPPKKLEEGARKAVVGKIAGAVHCFFSHFLCNHNDLVACFNHPDAQPKLTPELKLAIGIMREVLILPRFGSMRSFWITYKGMVEEGGKFVDSLGERRIRSQDILETFNDNPNLKAMYEIFLDTGHYIGYGLNLHCSHFDKRLERRERRQAEGEGDEDESEEEGEGDEQA